jgi:glycine betaine/proline transport system substrate-binding protein
VNTPRVSVSRRTLLGAAAMAPGLWSGAARSGERTIRIGWADWADAEAITRVAKLALEEQLGYRVELVKAGVAQLFEGVAKGTLDLMLMAWLPQTHKALWQPVAARTVDLGVLYSGTRIGWVVPGYVPESLASIDDLSRPDVLAKLGGRIHGIEPESGLMRSSRKAMEEYRLHGYQLAEGSDAKVVEALDRAVTGKEWVVATAWTPHYMFSKYSLRYLRDPKGVFGGSESVHALGRAGIEADHPAVASLVRQIRITVAELEALMYITQMRVYQGDAAMSTPERTAKAWVDVHRKRVAAWALAAAR